MILLYMEAVGGVDGSSIVLDLALQCLTALHSPFVFATSRPGVLAVKMSGDLKSETWDLRPET